MSAAQGRFTSPDEPFAGWDQHNPQSFNLYSYGRNNPLKYTDPDGHDVRICIDGNKDCFDLTDEQYKNLYAAQNGQQGIGMSRARQRRDILQRRRAQFDLVTPRAGT